MLDDDKVREVVVWIIGLFSAGSVISDTDTEAFITSLHGKKKKTIVSESTAKCKQALASVSDIPPAHWHS